MAFKATHRYARIAPRKARLVLDLIRGRDVEDALALLKFSKKRAAVLVDKVVRSAVANAGEQEADTGSLFVKEAWADPGPTMKRFMPRSEEHTSELQSHSDLVCRLLLEKKKRQDQHSPSAIQTQTQS